MSNNLLFLFAFLFFYSCKLSSKSTDDSSKLEIIEKKARDFYMYNHLQFAMSDYIKNNEVSENINKREVVQVPDFAKNV
jgi:hypothetical protein